jgi:hypothetical protein
MRSNIENCLKNALICKKEEKQYYEFSINEFVDNLKELRDRTKNGDFKALNEFFEIYVFNNEEKKQKDKNEN